MRAYLWAVAVATTALGCAGGAVAQSSNPFSGWFSRDTASTSAVALDLNVAGDDGGLERAIRNASLIRSALDEDRSTGPDLIAAARADYARILGVLYDEGYYSGVINIKLDGREAADIAPLDGPRVVNRVTVQVEPGPRFRFSRADIAPVAPGTDLPSGYAVGETAGTGTMRRAAMAGVDGWRDHGHAKADLADQAIVADHTNNRVDSRIALNPGPLVTFGHMHVSGLERMNERRLRKIAGFPEGERFDPADLDTVRKRLRRSGVFSAMTLTESDNLRPGNVMDVDLTVVENKKRRIGAGVEVSNTDGVMVSGFWMHRNLLGGGERFRVEGRVSDIGSKLSERDEQFSIRIDRPATITPDTTAYLETKLARMREEDYSEDSGSVALGFSHIVSDELTANTAIQYRFARVYEDDIRTDFRVLALPSDVVLDRRDPQNNAKRGYYLRGDVTPFVGFGDTDSGAQVIGEGRGYVSFGADDAITLAGRARIGSVLGADIRKTPRSYLFYSGGGGTVRGQPYQSLGVNVIQGASGTIKTGGMSIATATAEIRYQVRERIGVVAFADYGRVWTDGGFGGDFGSHAGAGLGVRYDTPIGPLRFDVAGPVSGNTGSGVQLYLGLGQAF
ncbi:autotransporter assembly complex family protein [Paracoccus sp. (in: a-proteobacteria)]|uniref:autotransporter assembly complex protein TamA n=1 Tax=Paracoccus sp. TaxID=267 RepID=UPI0026E06227|nr:autotransporter assembly complex family protein [Paracoccus sp. (in: a-proteobacteria)]MDO5647023.1 autotransporter assembly complex family protein [Paracoccus sp. (in: a-proteobacteria)]